MLDYFYIKNYYRLIAIDLSKQEVLDTDPKAIQKISFPENWDQDENTTMSFIIEEAKVTILEFSQATVRVL